MRIFSTFGVLGLLHVARGGELDAFARERAQNIRDNITARHSARVSSPHESEPPTSDTSVELPPAFQRVQERQDLHKRIVDRLDHNQDGHVDASELTRPLQFMWGDAETVQRMLHAYGISNIEEAIAQHTAGGNKVSKRELLKLAESRPHDNSAGYCPSIRTKIESCPSQNVMSCSNYLTSAEGFCNGGHKSLVETCIMSQPCGSICQCIQAVEKATEGTGSIEIIDQTGTAITADPFNAVGHPETGVQVHSKRFAFIFWAIIALIVALEITAILSDWTRTFQESRWIDSVAWDGSGQPPACSVYVFWGNCGAILSKTARNCPDGATRVYGNSCKDHLRYGSRGCGFWSLGCQSLCTNTNVKGCPCNMFDWAEFDDQNMPGSDIRSFFTTKVSECRTACSTDSSCKAFVMTPPKGNKDSSPNCWLKNAQRVTERSDGATTFFKKGASVADQCSASVTLSGAYDSDWWSGQISTKRSELAIRAGKGKFPFEYDRTQQQFRIAYLFMAVLYSAGVLTGDLMWNAMREIQRPIGDSTVNRGRNNNRPSNTEAPYVSNNALPQWYPTEIAYRVIAAWRAILTIAMEENPDDPVARHLTNNVPTTGGGPAQTAQYPPSVRNLLNSNSAIVHAAARGLGDTWIGRNTGITGKHTPPFANVQVGYDTRVVTYQRGAAGPFSIEAAFILATQVAGINFRAVARAIQQSNNANAWWVGALMPGDSSNRESQCLNEQASGSRVYGRYQRSGTNGQDDARAGVYIAFDLDPTAPDDSNHNVFVFIVHALDAQSVIQVANEGNLRQVNVTPYTPSQGKDDSRFWGARGSSTSRPSFPTANNRANTRQVAHAHAGVLSRSAFLTWVRSDSTDPFPTYTQISMLHLYILTEDWSMGPTDTQSDWPRKDWMGREPPPPGGGAGTTT